MSYYILERGWIPSIQPIDKKGNEITALPPVLKTLAHRGMVLAF